MSGYTSGQLETAYKTPRRPLLIRWSKPRYMMTPLSELVDCTSKTAGLAVTGEFLTLVVQGMTDDRYFLNNTRHLAWFNQPGNPWYRMPTFGIVNDLIEGRLLGEPGEGFFENLWVKRVEQGRMDADGLMLVSP